MPAPPATAATWVTTVAEDAPLGTSVDEKEGLIPADMSPKPPPGRDIVATGWLREYELMARDVCQAICLPKSIRGDPRAVLAVALTGRELGLGFMESTRLIDVINETPTLRAELKVRLARRAGYEIEIVHRDHNRIRLRGRREGRQEGHEVEWAISRRDEISEPSPDATIAEEVMFETWGDKRGERIEKSLTSKDNWQYVQQMLWALCVSQLLRENPPDEGGMAAMYSTEELAPRWEPEGGFKENGNE